MLDLCTVLPIHAYKTLEEADVKCTYCITQLCNVGLCKQMFNLFDNYFLVS